MNLPLVADALVIGGYVGAAWSAAIFAGRLCLRPCGWQDVGVAAALGLTVGAGFLLVLVAVFA